ncbi:NBS-LRR type resistance protein [Cucumis melo var. makuwa]|uniref:NBS-LRR type resistance protein n=1 Tax=Cucumis melo var. makuwa TaxID=1194695 RepID=A0A5A7U7P9_CUCMM|nr:NBS-LRR type resistance protein [Cucumis melo var. makuwa]
MYQSSDLEGYTYQSSDPKGCTYQSSDPEECTHQSRNLEGHRACKVHYFIDKANCYPSVHAKPSITVTSQYRSS